jgi:acetyl esterase/lipase
MRQRAAVPLGFGGAANDPWYRPPAPDAADPRFQQGSPRGRRAVMLLCVLAVVSAGSGVWLYRSFLAGHALFTCAVAAVRSAQAVGLIHPTASEEGSSKLASAQRVLRPANVHDFGDDASAVAIDRAETGSWWWFGQPTWCTVERSTRAGVVWWDVRAHGAPAAPAVLWLDGLFTTPAPAHIGCHWSAALNARILVPELAPEQSTTSQLIMHLHRVHRRLLAEAGASRSAVLATTPDSSWLALMSTLRLTKAAAEMPAALVLVSPLADLELDAHEGFRADAIAGDPMTGTRLERLARRLAGLAPGTASSQQPPSASTLHRLSPSWQALAGLPPVMVHWDRKELIGDQVGVLVQRLRESEVPVLEQARSGLGHGWLRLAPWSTPEGRLDMRAISRFLVQSGVK